MNHLRPLDWLMIVMVVGGILTMFGVAVFAE